MNGKGILYVVATPIGNMEDITIRALKVLRSANIIAAEDTRRTAKLLYRYRIKTPMTSFHEHNEQRKSDYLVRRLTEGDSIALVSDAGTPGISDPGQILVEKALSSGIEVKALPGPCAFVNALVVSGLSMEEFIFTGFLPRNRNNRHEKLKELADETATLIFYESPHRLWEILKDIREIMGNRRIAVSRELTKVHEETLSCRVDEVLEIYRDREPRGEFVIVLEGRADEEIERERRNEWRDMCIKDHYSLYIDEGYDRMEAMKKVASDRGISKRDVYRELNTGD